LSALFTTIVTHFLKILQETQKNVFRHRKWHLFVEITPNNVHKSGDVIDNNNFVFKFIV